MADRERVAGEPPRRTGKAVDAATQVIGVHGSHVFHNAACDELTDVAQAQRVLFVSPYDAVDGGYQPCPRCRPGP